MSGTSRAVTPSVTTVYTLTATNAAGSVTASYTYTGDDNHFGSTGSATFTIETLDDAVAEGRETVVVSIVDVQGGGLTPVSIDASASTVRNAIN